MNTGLSFNNKGNNIFIATFTEFSPDAETNTAQAKFYLESLQKISAERPGQKIKVLNDTRLISKEVKNLSNEARSLYLKAYKLPAIEQIAMVGFGPWLKNFIYILAQFAGRSAQTRFFETPEEALVWLSTPNAQ